MIVVDHLTPATAFAGGPAFDLAIETTAGSVPLDQLSVEVLWNGTPRPSTVQGARRVSASISADDVASAGTASVSIRAGAEDDPMGAPVDILVSLPVTFTIEEFDPVRLEILPADTTVERMSTVSYRAIGIGEDGSPVVDVSQSVEWRSFDSSVAIPMGAEVDAVGAGSTQITALHANGAPVNAASIRVLPRNDVMVAVGPFRSEALTISCHDSGVDGFHFGARMGMGDDFRDVVYAEGDWIFTRSPREIVTWRSGRPCALDIVGDQDVTGSLQLTAGTYGAGIDLVAYGDTVAGTVRLFAPDRSTGLVEQDPLGPFDLLADPPVWVSGPSAASLIVGTGNMTTVASTPLGTISWQIGDPQTTVPNTVLGWAAIPEVDDLVIGFGEELQVYRVDHATRTLTPLGTPVATAPLTSLGIVGGECVAGVPEVGGVLPVWRLESNGSLVSRAGVPSGEDAILAVATPADRRLAYIVAKSDVMPVRVIPVRVDADCSVTGAGMPVEINSGLQTIQAAWPLSR